MPSLESQYGQTLFLASVKDGGSAKKMQRVQFHKSKGAIAEHDESLLQRLIMQHPALLPVDQIEPAVTPLVPICVELPMKAGLVDNFLATPSGDLVLVECKLWRNPQARREVVGQILDYASELSTWTYAALEGAIRQTTPLGSSQKETRSLYELVSSTGEIDEALFHDAVVRNLKRGRFLLLIVGDGIRAETEVMTEFLQRHGALHFTLALIELALFRLEGVGYVAQPRVLAKTLMIERVVNGGAASPVPAGSSDSSTSGAKHRTTITQEDYLERLENTCPGVASKLLSFVEIIAGLNVLPEFGTDAMILRWRPTGEKSWNLGTIASNGDVWMEYMGQQAASAGLSDAHGRYLQKLADLVPGAVVKPTKSVAGRPIVVDGKTVKIDKLVSDQLRCEGWRDAIAEFQKTVIKRTQED